MPRFEENETNTQRFRTMLDNQFDEELMDYLDGLSSDATKEVAIQGNALKKIISDLKDIPLENINPETDKRVYQFIEYKIAQSNRLSKIKNWIPYVAAAASILLILFIVPTKKSLQNDYLKLSSNPDKVSFIYKLNDQVLSIKDINWLQEELKTESNPNIKVTIIDLLSKHSSKLEKRFFDHLQYENLPTVQMALLSILEGSQKIDFQSELRKFMQKKDLDNAVKLKVNDILSSQFN